MVMAPYQLPPGSATDLDGAANMVDHATMIAGFPWPARLAYAVGDLVCHQQQDRSWTFGGNQAPVDSRMFAMFLAANLGFAVALATRSRPGFSAGWERVLGPRRAWLGASRRPVGALWLSLAWATAPVALDAGLQLVTTYESTNVVRTVTGAWTGAWGALWLALAFDALWGPHPGPDNPAASPTPRDGF